MTIITAKKIAQKNISGKKTANEKEGRIKRQIFVKWGEENERQTENNVNCEEMRFVIRNLVYVEDPAWQWRQKFILMSARTTSVFPQRGRDDAAQRR